MLVWVTRLSSPQAAAQKMRMYQDIDEIALNMITVPSFFICEWFFLECGEPRQHSFQLTSQVGFRAS